MLIEQRNSLKGEINIPGDKSISHRAIMFGALAKGTTEIDGFLMDEDCLSTIACFRKMQVGIEILPDNKVRVHGNGVYGLKSPTSPLNTAKSGTTIRLLLGLLSGQPFNSTIIRDESAQRKIVGRIVKPLRKMGAVINGRDDGNLCPLNICPSNKLKGMIHNLTVLDMHVKSPILIAGFYGEGDTTIIEACKSRDHTELMMNYFGANIKVNGLNVTSHEVENLYAQHVDIPGDASIAAYFIAAGILVPNSDLVIKNVGINPTRTGIIDVFKMMGAKIDINNERIISNEKVADIHVTSSQLNAVTIEGEIVPRLLDEVPIIAVAASIAKGTTIIKDLTGFKIKELGKLKLLTTELSKLGASIHETEDGLIIEGGRTLKGTVVESYNDYIIAVTMSIAGLIAQGETMIRKAQILDIVLPEFLPVLNSL